MVNCGEPAMMTLGWVTVLGLPIAVLIWAVCWPDDRG
jgi:hypothetical protein